MNGYNMICEIALKYRHRLKKAILSNSWSAGEENDSL
jgi:hypothetical protein